MKNRLRKAPPNTVLHERGGGGWEMSDDDMDTGKAPPSRCTSAAAVAATWTSRGATATAATRTATVSTTTRAARHELLAN